MMRSNLLLLVGVALCQFAGAAGAESCTDPHYKKARPPVYPDVAIKQRTQGKTILKLTVNVDGTPNDVIVETSSGSTDLDDAALAAIADWRFEPRRCDGKAVVSSVRVPLNFTLTRADGSSATSMPKGLRPDDRAMEFPTAVQELYYLQNKAGVEDHASPHRHSFSDKTGTWWLFEESADEQSRAVLRVREAVLTPFPELLYAYVCDGVEQWCTSHLDQQLAFILDSPPPPPVPSP